MENPQNSLSKKSSRREDGIRHRLGGRDGWQTLRKVENRIRANDDPQIPERQVSHPRF